MQRQPPHGLSAHRMLDMVHRLSRLQAGGTDPASLLRAILQDTLAITDSRGGGRTPAGAGAAGSAPRCAGGGPCSGRDRNVG